MSETLIKNYQPDTVVEMKDSEELVDGYENQISNYLLALSHKGINEAESQKLSVLLYTVNDIETISDQVCNIGIAYRGLDAKENAFLRWRCELSVLQELETELVDKNMKCPCKRRDDAGCLCMPSPAVGSVRQGERASYVPIDQKQMFYGSGNRVDGYSEQL